MDGMKPDSSGFWGRVFSYIGDWAIALVLSAIVFWGLIQWQQPNVPEQAPLWSLPSIEGNLVSLEEFKGKTVVLSFWATYCGVCRQETPAMSAFGTQRHCVIRAEVLDDTWAVSSDFAVLCCTPQWCFS